jgi:PAS domain S-box-containing protein
MKKQLKNIDLVRELGIFAGQIQSVKSHNDLIDAVRKILEIIIPSEYSALYLYDDSEGKLKLYYAKGFTEDEKKRAEETAMLRHPGKVFMEKVIINVPDVENDPNNTTADSPRSFIVKSRLFIPVMNRDQAVGAFGVVSSFKNRFDETDIELLKFICQMTGVVFASILIEQEKEKALKELILRERAIISSNNGIIITDSTLKDNPTIYANPAFYLITGYTPEEVIGINCRFLQRDDNSQESLGILRSAIEQGKSCKVTIRNYKKDGSLFWNELAISPVHNEIGKVTNFVGIISDVTNSIEGENRLKESQTRLLELIQSIASGILVEDDDRRIVTANKEFCNLFGVPTEPEMHVGLDCSLAAEYSKHLFKDPGYFVRRIDEILSKKEKVINEEIEFSDGRIFERDYIPVYIGNNYKGHLWNYRDITDRKKNEETIKQSELYTRSLLEAIPDLIFVFDAGGNFIDYKGGDSDNLAADRYSFIGKNISDVLPPFIASETKKRILLLLDGKQADSLEYELETLKGKGYFEAKFFPFGIDKVLTFIRDISKTKETEYSLQQNIKHQEILSEIALQLNILEDFDYKLNRILSRIGEHTDVSRVYIFQDDSEDNSTSNKFEWCNKGIEPQIDQLQNIPYQIIPSWKRILFETGRIYSENINNLPDDIRAILEPQEIKSIIVYPVFVSQRFFGFIGFDECVRFKKWTKSELELLRAVSGVIANAYERKIAEEELVKIKNQLESVLNTVKEGIITIDINGIVVLINNEVENMFLCKRSEIIGKPVASLLPDKYHKILNNSIANLSSIKPEKRYGNMLSLEGMKKDGARFPAQIKIQETIIGNESFFTLAINDITELNNLIVELENSNRSLSDFAYIASHDLREPLRKITAFGSLLNKSVKDKLDTDDKENLQFMIDGSLRMQGMIDDLLTYSRIRKSIKPPKEINLDEILNEIISFDLSELIEQNQAKVIIENKLGTIYGDRLHFKQLLQNLIANGIKYRKKDRIPHIKIRSLQSGLFYQVQVEDNGIGIEENYKTKIFEMFRRLHSKDEYEGSGIGLAICKKIIEIYKGEIFVESRIGEGSTFIFNIPLKGS